MSWFLWPDSDRPPISAPVVKTFSTRQEATCRLLALPAELRVKIYEAVLCSRKIHCVSIRNDMGYYECANPAACECHLRICPDNNNDYKPFVLWWEAKHLPPGVKRPSLQLLRTCRQIYVEAAHLPYTGNEFILHSIWSLSDIPKHMPSHRVSQIRTLRVVFNFGRRSAMPGTVQRPSNTLAELPTPDGAWKSAWEKLPLHFVGVRELSIWLETLAIENLLVNGNDAWIQPLLPARKLPLERCTVKLTAYNGEYGSRIAGLPALEKSIEALMLETADS